MLKKTVFIFTILAFCTQYLYSIENKYNIRATSAVIIHPETNNVLFQKNMLDKVYPASITKLMSLYLVFEALKDNVITLDSIVTVSKNAYTKGNYRNGVSTMFLRQGQRVSVADLITGIAVTSANDATIALAEFVSGTESNFVDQMNKKAKELGLANTKFVNVEGLYNKNHYTTAYDIAILTKSIMENFPEYYHFFSIDKISFNEITQYNRNTLINFSFNDNIIVDGLKTGHIDESGYSVAFSAIKNDNFRILGVVMGTDSEKARESEVSKLLHWFYSNYEKRIIYNKGDIIKELPVYNGISKKIQLIVDTDIVFLVPKDMSNSDIKQNLIFRDYYNAPIIKGEQIATLEIQTTNEDYNISYNLVAQQNIDKSSSLFSYILSPYYAIKKLIGF